MICCYSWFIFLINLQQIFLFFYYLNVPLFLSMTYDPKFWEIQFITI